MIHEFVRGGGRAVRVRVRVRVRVKKEEEENKKGEEDAFFDWRTAAGAGRCTGARRDSDPVDGVDAGVQSWCDYVPMRTIREFCGVPQLHMHQNQPWSV